MSTAVANEDVQTERIRAENEKLARRNRDLQDMVIATTENDRQLAFRFATSKALQDEFSSEGAYLAYMHNQRAVAESPAFQRRLATELHCTPFMEKVEQYKRAHQCSTSEAVSKCVDLHRDLHAQMTGGK